MNEVLRKTRPVGVTPAALAADRAQALALVPVSRETAERLDQFVAVLLDYQQRMNLIAHSTEPIIWTRHIADSLQLLALAEDARIWVDFGSGAGFPGLVIACAMAEIPGALVHLVESSTKKAAFLREAARLTGAAAEVHAERAESFVGHAPGGIDVVTARAVAPLTELLGLAYPLLKKGARGVFPKGQDVDAELTEAAKCWNIKSTLATSQTDERARIIILSSLEPKPGRARNTT
jgi:16S rRNA (guanine527-N7)-methyltransferase